MEINKGFMFHVVLCEDDKNCKGWLGTTISIIARTLRSMISSEPIRTFLPTDAFFDKSMQEARKMVMLANEARSNAMQAVTKSN